jgi:hypothetical protein
MLWVTADTEGRDPAEHFYYRRMFTEGEARRTEQQGRAGEGNVA